PDADCFTALTRNIARLELSNVIAVPAAIVPEAAWRLAGGHDASAIDTAGADAMQRHVHLVPFVMADRGKRFLRRAEPTLLTTLTGANVRIPSLPASLLPRLVPNVVKLTAPGWEAD